MENQPFNRHPVPRPGRSNRPGRKYAGRVVIAVFRVAIVSAGLCLSTACATIAVVKSDKQATTIIALNNSLRGQSQSLVTRFQRRGWMETPPDALSAIASVLIDGSSPDANKARTQISPAQLYLNRHDDSIRAGTFARTLSADISIAGREAHDLNELAQSTLKKNAVGADWREQLSEYERASFALERSRDLFKALSLAGEVVASQSPETTRSIQEGLKLLATESRRTKAQIETLAAQGEAFAEQQSKRTASAPPQRPDGSGSTPAKTLPGT